jgi:hypothetical protein
MEYSEVIQYTSEVIAARLLPLPRHKQRSSNARHGVFERRTKYALLQIHHELIPSRGFGSGAEKLEQFRTPTALKPLQAALYNSSELL